MFENIDNKNVCKSVCDMPKDVRNFALTANKRLFANIVIVYF